MVANWLAPSSLFRLVLRACTTVGSSSLEAPWIVASCPWGVEHTTSTLEIEVSRKSYQLWNGVMDVVFTHGAELDVHQKTVMACMVTPNPRGPADEWAHRGAGI